MTLVGDFVPQKFRPVCRDLPEGEIVLANLEGPICDDNLSQSIKVGVHLHSARFDLPGKWAFALANNHLMDFGGDGLRQTFDFLRKKGFAHAGAGINVDQARKPMVLEESGKRIAVFSCCERQFGLATNSSCGVAEKGEWLFDAVRAVKNSHAADHIVVSCHAASEFSPFVAPSVRTFYHRLVDVGVDVVHGHHSHVPQGLERYGHGVICYGLGNFMVDVRQWRKPNNQWSNVVHVDFSNGVRVGPLQPYRIVCNGEQAVCLSARHADGAASFECYNELASSQFESDAFCEAVWQEACIRLYHRIYEQLLRAASVESVRLSVRDRLRKLYFAAGDVARTLVGCERSTPKSRFYARTLYNYFNCESHADVIRTALGVLTGSCADLRCDASQALVDKLLP